MRQVRLLVLTIGMAVASTVAVAGNDCKNPADGQYNHEFCVNRRAQVEARKKVIESEGELRVPETGAVFKRDISNPSLGEAYVDPSGLIWGDIATVNGGDYSETFYYALDYCKSIGARLPTRKETERLFLYLGSKYPQDKDLYMVSNKLSDGKTQIIPGLDDVNFWTSTQTKHYGIKINYFYKASYGFIENGKYVFSFESTGYQDYSDVRCVMQKAK